MAANTKENICSNSFGNIFVDSSNASISNFSQFVFGVLRYV